MQLQRQFTRQVIDLGSNSPLGVGGEARIFAVPQEPSLVAKVYHRPTDTHTRKLTAMLANPPDDPMAAQGHISIAWPTELLRTVDGSSRVVGFLMPRVTGVRPIIDFYNPKARRQQCPLFNYRYLYRTARNMATALRALHLRGYVIGDVNESNILVTDTALLTLVDTDSFQVGDPSNGVVYRCPVGKPEFTPPELQGRVFAHIDRTPEHDLFGLAVIIFLLLLEGTHPFAGIYQGGGDPPPYDERIAAGHFPHGRRRVPYRPMPHAPPFDLLSPPLQLLFLRCFEDGHHNPQARPDAQMWRVVLDEAERTLVTCPTNAQHCYPNHLQACPWCARTGLLGGLDPFPSQQALGGRQRSGTPQRPRPPRPTRRPTRPAPATTPVSQPPPPPARWRPAVRWAIGVVLLLLVFGTWWWKQPGSPPQPPVQETRQPIAPRVGETGAEKPQPPVAARPTPQSPVPSQVPQRQPVPPEPKPEVPAPLDKTVVNSIGMTFVLIPAGTFGMGSNNGDNNEKPVHEVRLSKSFHLGQYEVTQGQWQAVMGNNPSQFKGDPNLPVESVSWEDVQEFIRRLNAKEGGNRYRLPTEAEWEYAARAGSTTAYSFGDDPRQLGGYAWFAGNSGTKTHPVGQKKPNAWGLHDMHGNVWEWVHDWYGPYSASTVTDPQGPASGSYRVYRGGSWIRDAGGCRSSDRSLGTPGHRSGTLGFRLLRTAP